MRACSVSGQDSHIPLDRRTFLQWLSRWWRGQHESGSPSFSISKQKCGAGETVTPKRGNVPLARQPFTTTPAFRLSRRPTDLALKSSPLPISAAVLDFRATEQDAITPRSFTDNRRPRRLCGEPKTTANSSQDGQARCGSADCESLTPNWSIVG